MRKLNKKEIQQITEKLKPFWKEYWRIYSKYACGINKLQKKMNQKLKLPIELEFFYVDGECVGIGATEFSDRKVFPLIDSRELS